MTLRLAMLVSGSGTLREAVSKAGVPVQVVFADRPCTALEVAEAEGIDTLLIDRRDYGYTKAGFPQEGRDRFSLKVAEELNARGITIVSMAGWGTELTQPFFDTYTGIIINNHPALLPAFKGWHAVRDALAYGVKVTGCTIHHATVGVDEGPIIAQVAVKILPDDTEDSLQERIKVVERKLLIEVLHELMDISDDAPYCMKCAIQMQRAGSSFACPSCGSTRGCD